jgi:hypothetical protein
MPSYFLFLTLTRYFYKKILEEKKSYTKIFFSKKDGFVLQVFETG